ncbi:MAG: DUF2357 domain-containing protein, partial [Bacteroidota bacterium]
MRITFSHLQKGTVYLDLIQGKSEGMDLEVKGKWESKGMNVSGHLPEGRATFFQYQHWSLQFVPKAKAPYKAPYRFELSEALPTVSVTPDLYQAHWHTRQKLGFVTLYLKDVEGKRVWQFDTEVFPALLHYKEDFRAIYEDLSSWIQTLAYRVQGASFSYLKPTLRENSPSSPPPQIWTYWIKQRKKAHQDIAKQPHPLRRKEIKVLPPRKILKPVSPTHPLKTETAIPTPVWKEQVDTPVNRWIKWCIQKVNTLATSDSFGQELIAINQSFLQQTFLKEVQAIPPSKIPQ